MRRLTIGLLALVWACGGSGQVVPDVASSSIGVGEQRVLVALVDVETNQYAASPDLEVTATLRDRIGSPLGEYPGEFVWVVPDVRGLYAFHVEIPGSGTFQMTFEAEDLGELGPVGLVAVEDPPGIGIGELAPLSETKTADGHPLSEITSDPEPDPAFYEMTVAEAVTDGPSVIIFGTPAWCTSQACGPMLDQVKALSADYPELNYVHVEVYDNINVETFEELVLVPSVAEWGLVSEPWVFVTDDEGTVSASFEGAVSDAELTAAFESVAG